MKNFDLGEMMFGYVRPLNSELLVKDSELYKAVYCGLCRYGGKNISHLTRWLLNYDFVLFALLRMALTDERVCVLQKRCPYKLKKTNCLCADGAYGLSCSAFGLLTCANLEDDIKDKKGVKRFFKKMLLPLFRHIKNKSDRKDGLADIVKKGMDTVSAAEKENCTSVDKAADGCGVMMGEIAAHGITDVERKRIAFTCGYHIGRFVYLIDAFDDLAEDEKSGNYNPFLAHYGSLRTAVENKEKIAETLYDSLNVFSNSYGLCCETNQTAIDRLVFNISELGGREAVKKILKGLETE